MVTLVHAIRDLEEVAEEIHHQKALVSMFRSKGPDGGFTTNFRENRSHPLLKKPLFMTSMGLGNLSRPLKATGTEEGVSPLASVPLNPYDKLYDYLAVMKLGMEMTLNLLRAFPDDVKKYFGRRPSEKHSLAFAVSKIVVRDLGLTETAQSKLRIERCVRIVMMTGYHLPFSSNCGLHLLTAVFFVSCSYVDLLDLAHDILYELVPDDETEQEYLELVRD
jgi:hypothetical protein